LPVFGPAAGSLSGSTSVDGNAGQANYAVAKAGVTGLTKTIAKEWGPAFGVRANTIAFGYITTRLTQAKEAGAVQVLPDGTKVVLGRSVEHERCLENKKESIRAFVHLIAWVLSPDKKDPAKTKVSYILYVDPKGKIPKSFYESNIIEQASYVRKLKEYIESRQ